MCFVPIIRFIVDQMGVQHGKYMYWCVLVCFFSSFCKGEVGRGIWHIENIASCPLSESNVIQTNMTKKKISRIQDGFSGGIDLGIPLSPELSLTADICQVLDGGCKPFMVMKDDSFCNFMSTYMLDLFEELLGLWGVEEKNCPVAKGVYSVEDYPFNYSRLKPEAVYGTFDTEAKLYDTDKEVMCLNVLATFSKHEDDDE